MMITNAQVQILLAFMLIDGCNEGQKSMPQDFMV